MITDKQLQALRRRAHLHSDRCYGMYQVCGEHHMHDATCGSRSLICGQREEPDLALLLDEMDRLRAITDAARKLSGKLALVHGSDAFRAVWGLYATRGVAYEGPRYDGELAALDAALAAEPR